MYREGGDVLGQPDMGPPRTHQQGVQPLEPQVSEVSAHPPWVDELNLLGWGAATLASLLQVGDPIGHEISYIWAGDNHLLGYDPPNQHPMHTYGGADIAEGPWTSCYRATSPTLGYHLTNQ